MNAMDAVAHRPVADRRVIVRTDIDGLYVRILVRDSGDGLPPGSEGRVFEPFFSLKSAGRGERLSLGLAIARSIVDHHDGTIAAGNDAREGAVISIRLPRAEPSSVV
jgi:C4-dicarboxylate-specific signal transduction histidine kinase